MFSYEGLCVQFEIKKHTTLVFLLLSCPQTLNYFMTDPSNIIFWRFRCMITRLKDRVQMSMISRRVLVQVFCGYDVQMNLYVFYFERKSTFKQASYSSLRMLNHVLNDTTLLLLLAWLSREIEWLLSEFLFTCIVMYSTTDCRWYHHLSMCWTETRYLSIMSYYRIVITLLAHSSTSHNLTFNR